MTILADFQREAAYSNLPAITDDQIAELCGVSEADRIGWHPTEVDEHACEAAYQFGLFDVRDQLQSVYITAHKSGWSVSVNSAVTSETVARDQPTHAAAICEAIFCLGTTGSSAIPQDQQWWRQTV